MSFKCASCANHKPYEQYYYWNDGKDQNENLLKNLGAKLKVFKIERPNENKPKYRDHKDILPNLYKDFYRYS